MSDNKLYKKLRLALREVIEKHHLFGESIDIRCRVLSAEEAIGRPEHDDYPIIKGKEVMIEALFRGAQGQAFADEFENATYTVEELLSLELDSNRKRASFIAGLNAIFRYLELCDKTIHCKDEQPIRCANNLPSILRAHEKILLIGHQPRFFEQIASTHPMRIIDLDADNIGKKRHGVIIEPVEMTEDAIQWCDLIFATGSTVVNGSMSNFLERGKPVIFYGVTVSATAKILNLNAYCHCGN